MEGITEPACHVSTKCFCPARPCRLSAGPEAAAYGNGNSQPLPPLALRCAPAARSRQPAAGSSGTPTLLSHLAPSNPPLLPPRLIVAGLNTLPEQLLEDIAQQKAAAESMRLEFRASDGKACCKVVLERGMTSLVCTVSRERLGSAHPDLDLALQTAVAIVEGCAPGRRSAGVDPPYCCQRSAARMLSGVCFLWSKAGLGMQTVVCQARHNVASACRGGRRHISARVPPLLNGAAMPQRLIHRAVPVVPELSGGLQSLLTERTAPARMEFLNLKGETLVKAPGSIKG